MRSEGLQGDLRVAPAVERVCGNPHELLQGRVVLEDGTAGQWGTWFDGTDFCPQYLQSGSVNMMAVPIFPPVPVSTRLIMASAL